MDARKRAKLSAQAMWRDDIASRAQGLKMISVAPGSAVFCLTVKPEQLNGHGICHGGFIFLLADTAFAFACNSYNQACVAQHNSITYLNPARESDKLTATAREINLTGRNGIYDVNVANQRNEVIAEFRGLSRTIKGSLFDEAACHD